jgi:AcrR family transcriptional regulator
LEDAMPLAPRPSATPRAPRWHRQPEERPQQILDAAFRVFGAQGLHQATLDDVAREAGITKGTIYLYFPSKADLFSAMLKSRVNDILPRLEAAGRGGRREIGPGDLVAFGRRLYRFMRSPAYLNMFRTIVGEAAQFPDAAEGVYRDGILVANRRMGAVLAQGMAAGLFREVDPVVASRAFAGMFLVFAVSQGLLGGERVYPIPESTVVNTLTGIFLNGLMKSRGPLPAAHPPVGQRQVGSAGRRGAVPRSRRLRVSASLPQAGAAAPASRPPGVPSYRDAAAARPKGRRLA